MTAHNPISTSTEIRQSEKNRWERCAASIIGGSRLSVTREFIAEFLLLYESKNERRRTAKQERPSARGDPGRSAVARHLAVNLQDSRHRSGPRKSLRLLIAPLFHLRAQRRIKQRPLQASPDLKHVFRIHQQRRVPHNFRQARSVRSDHRSPVSHRFERRQSKSLVE